MSEMGDGALEKAARGWYVGPMHESIGGICSCHEGINCKSKGKHPRTAHGFKDFTRNPDQIRAWWRRWPFANVGGATGEHDGHSVVVLDLDLPKRNDVAPAELATLGITGGYDSLLRLCAEANQPWPSTRTHQTQSGAMHLIYRAPAGIRIPSTTSVLAWKVDVKADGGMISLPPSTVDERPYFQRTDGDIPQDVRPLPEWLLERVRAKPRPARPTRPVRLIGGSRYVEAAITAELDAIKHCKSGLNEQIRNSSFNLGTLVGASLIDRDLIRQDITDAAAEAGVDPGERKAQDTIRRALDAGAQHPRTVPEKRAS